MKRILLAEDHILTAIGTKHILLQHFKEVEIYATENLEDTVELLDKQVIDLLILDVDIPGGGKLNMIESIRMRKPLLPILMFSGQDEQIYAIPFLKAGADGYVSKRATIKEFVTAVESVLSNHKYLSYEMIQENIRVMTQTDYGSTNPLQLLTQREVEVAQLLVQGCSSTEISKKLYLSVSAISIYKSRIFQKLAIKNVIELSSLLNLNQ